MKHKLAIGALIIVGGIAYLTWPNDEPSASSTPQSSVAQGALAKVLIPEMLSQNAQIGKRAFDAACAACHGANAAGQDGVAPPLVHKIYEPSHHGDDAFQRAAASGVRAHHWRFGNMPPVEGVTRGDVTMIIAYIRELQRANGIN
ncbi:MULTISPECIES: c-type cytochrome [Pacificibacter]|uniref:c-type cytochrome n=1 Tax=Pacificibacter TaxID=1042323 RepID=UPI001C0A2401|nr:MULTISPECIES: cytochrome c [Pacificibacter]MBU2936481.1 cytochrome c [Pacificibacter marinus]MDO6614717.1 cytochrome c [Pacificibacter sp. 1_MG-2023]